MTAFADDAVLAEARDKGVYFFLPFPDGNIYGSICLAEGLEELGIPVFANVDAYPKPYAAGTPYLFKASASHPSAAAFTVVDISAIDDKLDPRAPYELLRQLKGRSAALCIADKGAELGEWPGDIPTFVAHASKFVCPLGWHIPWAFGLNRDVLQKIEQARGLGGPRQFCFVRDFRPSFSQPVRQALDLAFVTPLAQLVEIDRRIDDDTGRFLNRHYERLAGARGCLAYGGAFTENYLKHAWLREQGVRMAPMIGDGPFVIRWDSWRFWESLAIGCATVSLDCEEYGFALPVTPQNGVHYVGLRFDKLGEAVDFLAVNEERLAAIGEAGRQWVLEHYAPQPVALRWLGEMAKAYGEAG